MSAAHRPSFPRWIASLGVCAVVGLASSPVDASTPRWPRSDRATSLSRFRRRCYTADASREPPPRRFARPHRATYPLPGPRSRQGESER